MSNSNIDDILDWNMHMLFKQAIIQDISNSKELKLTQEIIDEARGKAEQAIQQELLKARIDELLRFDTDEDTYRLLRLAELRDLQAKLKGDDK